MQCDGSHQGGLGQMTLVLQTLSLLNGDKKFNNSAVGEGKNLNFPWQVARLSEALPSVSHAVAHYLTERNAHLIKISNY